MCCGCGPRSKSSPEYKQPYKPENNVGCGIRSVDCNTPSLAAEGSPRWRWEQQYGKLVTTFVPIADSNGHTHYLVERTPCPLQTNSHRTSSCCSVRYQMTR